MHSGRQRPGATCLGDGRCRFVVWAPHASSVDVHLLAPVERVEPLTRHARGYFAAIVNDVQPGALYRYRLDGDREFPDPASRYQPEGVHGPSAVVNPAAFEWSDGTWRGVRQRDLVIYELHVGTFSANGTFGGVIPCLGYLADLGVTAIELLPVAQFPGDRNWGYDGTYPYAVQHSYGGPDGLRRLIDACHAHGLAVLLDCVYNHLGPDGNYLGQYGPYFTDRYQTPWGQAVNTDGAGSDEVRHYFVENGLHWIYEYHIDGFRLDAADRIIDESATHFLRAFASAMREQADALGRRVVVIAESDANDARYIEPVIRNGHGLHAQWGDDFHHALHALLTGERSGYYRDFGTLTHLAKAMRQTFVYDGVYSESRERTHGNSPRATATEQFVVATQNHDQVGNRAAGERLSHLVSLECAKLAAVTVLLSPYLPLIFMGEEYAETAPFQYFTSHTDADLAEAVSRGRREEFAGFAWAGDVPDPQDVATFQRSKLNHGLREREPHRSMCALYRELLRLRRELPALRDPSKDRLEVIAHEDEQCLGVRRWSGEFQAVLALNFSERPQRLALHVPSGDWRVALSTADARWSGPGCALPETFNDVSRIELELAARSAVLLERRVEP
ncbi:MAG TPA: malto-oligosyltrehalose trehalohydrolase [Thermomicrobiales bacterium]|nr:malto-oligosyltrehalose trehalohydrolase [Thermomicrobiales bacterium]